MKKKIFILILLMFITTGCTSLSNKGIDTLVQVMLQEKNHRYNVVFDGYKYYVPKGMKFITKDEYNATFMDQKNNVYYFYSDVIRYYNHEKLNYKKRNDIYYSEKLEYNKKVGYIEIRQFDHEGHYLIEYMYNYGKLEAIVLKEDISDVLLNMGSILSSLTFNRPVLETLIGNKVLNYKEETYNVMEPKGERFNTESYLDYEERYGTYEGYTPKDTDEDEIEINEGE